jgi:hypothetical protein
MFREALLKLVDDGRRVGPDKLAEHRLELPGPNITTHQGFNRVGKDLQVRAGLHLRHTVLDPSNKRLLLTLGQFHWPAVGG